MRLLNDIRSRRHRRRRRERAIAAGAAIGGSLVGGPQGAAAAQLLTAVASEVSARSIGDRGQWRTEVLQREAVLLVRERIGHGERPRADGFFDAPQKIGARLAAPWGYASPPAYELVEAALMNAGRTFEERKLPYLAALMVALWFDDSLAPPYCHQLQQLAERLTYRQLVVLAVFARRYRHPAIGDRDRFSDEHGATLEVDGLVREGLLGTSNPDAPGTPARDLGGVGMAYVAATAAGLRLDELMRLDRIGEEELAAVVEQIAIHDG